MRMTAEDYERVIEKLKEKIDDLQEENVTLRVKLAEDLKVRGTDKKIVRENKMLRGCLINILKCLINAGLFKGYNIIFPKGGESDNFSIFYTKEKKL